MKPVRILHLTWGLDIGGKERFLNALIRGLPESEFELHICCLRKQGVYYGPLCRDGYSVRFLDKKPGLDLAAAVRLKRLINELDPDIIHTHEFTSLFLLEIASFLGAPHRHTVVSLHGGHARLRQPKSGLHLAMLRRSNLVIGVSERQVAALKRQLARTTSLIHIPYGIRAEPVQCSPASGEKPGAIAPSRKRPVIAMVARFEKPKDQDSLVRAVLQMRQEFSKMECVLVGEGQRRKTIEVMVQRLGLSDTIRVVAGTTDVSDIISHADVCVLSSFHEGLPICILEYMAARKPVVASDVGGVSELVRDGEEGFLVEAGNSGALADKISFLLRSPDIAREMGKKAHERANSRFQMQRMLDAYAQSYKRLTQ
jgi:glycosyltransferase involved in cell wall biosynthesis